ncbi:hypothetical protein ETAA8_09650 [Anatilimnocola aggregata]|uniref:Uncharacterized protein n=1 Tax=Anatilimnocola aggregata TaxID=2528021 RepID=A0A517Y6N2_9BACT|nr:hypothetical protein [Anatilimnocola aggregata]QDU25893.1 hypothetical protein ETAA8_09650 [Anatilimnocola aggregata]
MKRKSAKQDVSAVISMLDSRAGLRTLLRETQNLIAFYAGCIDVDDAVRLESLSLAKISVVRHKIGKYATWLAKNVAAFRPLQELPAARWQRVNEHLPDALRHDMESHRDIVRECRNAIEKDSCAPLSTDDFAHRYGNHVREAQEAIRGLTGVYEDFEGVLCHRLDTLGSTQPAAKANGRGRKSKPHPLLPSELQLLRHYEAARRQGTSRKEFCDAHGIKVRELTRLQGKVRAMRGRQRKKNAD